MKGEIEKITDNKILQSILLILLFGGIISCILFVVHYIRLFYRLIIDGVIADWNEGSVLHHIILIYGGATLIYWLVGVLKETAKEKNWF